MFNRKLKYPIAIDIGNQSISAVQLTETRQGLTVRGWAHQQLEEEFEGIPAESDTLVPILKEMVKSKKFLGKRAVAHIPPKNIVSFPIKFHVPKTENPEAVILRDAKEYLPFPVEEAIIDYPSIASMSADGTNHYKATVIVVRREQINQYLRMFKQAGLVVEAVDFGVSSLIRLHQYLCPAISGTVILCHVGHTQSLLSVITHDGILAQRHIPWGMQILLARLLTNLGLSEDKKTAKILLKKYGLLYEERDCSDNIENTPTDGRCRAIYQIITPYVDELIYEFHKIIAYVRSENPNVVFESICIYGQANLILHLDRYLEKRLNISTKRINPLEKIAFSDVIQPAILEDASIIPALGLAMRKVRWL